MGSYVITTQDAKITQKVVHKFSKDIVVDNNNIRGKFTITRYRKYAFRDEVDIVFKGEIYVTYHRNLDWYPSSIMSVKKNGYKVSKVKVNRYIRKFLYKETERHLNYFDIKNFRYYTDIKKITWL